MSYYLNRRPQAFVGTLVVGLLAGALLGDYWPHTPIHAVATHGNQTFAIATGPLDDRMEGVFFLDYLTGDLRGAALNFRTGRFSAFFERNIAADLGLADVRNPQFLMVTGAADFIHPPGQTRQGRTVIYVAETTSGWLGAYVMPWFASGQGTSAPFASQFVLLDRRRIRNAPVQGP